MNENQLVFKMKASQKEKITNEVKYIVLYENFLHPNMCLREKGISI